jgi:hypothetical protein
MRLKSRHYNNNQGINQYFFGIMLYDKKQPTLDIIFGNHVFVMFWARKD